ncbi:alpha/beta fold hydrolase [Inquilinus sp. Marseille-Q2685]|uniref:alpha/beta fold hydrolase n=1 Tax=Inquilinus sp. Marseille-Q2685 TaxID=2866581 RepID=UPI001CE43750|nr:alpha/beta fold hydrolase [Inquilinus sp. Marseille-Q2685]
MRWIFVLILFLAAGTTAAAEPQPPFFIADDCPAGMILPETVAAECGTVTVLENRADAVGPRIRLRVATLRRTDRELRPDPLLFIQGGPGGPAGLDAKGLSNWATALRTADWLGARPLVLFDQRGVGESRLLPTRCRPFDRYARQSILDHTQPARETWVAGIRESAKRCWARFREAGHDPAQITTAAIAADIVDLRQALGQPAWNLWGISFGSRVAMIVMRDHPEGLRSVILEGVLPPEANVFDDAANSGQAFDALVRACRTSTTCNKAYPDLEPRFFALVRRLDEEPLTVKISDHASARIDGWMLRDIVIKMLRLPADATFVPFLIDDLEANETRILKNMKKYELQQVRKVDEIPDQAVYASIACADLIPAEPEWIEQASARDARFADQIEDEQIDGCSPWPVPRSPEREAAPVTSDIPALLISGAFDPTTPASWAEAAVKRLANGTSYVFPAYGHGVLYYGDACAGSIAGRFLDDPTRRPDDDCLADLRPLVFAPPPPRQRSVPSTAGAKLSPVD